MDDARRQAYLLAAAVATVVQLGLIALDLQTHNWIDLISSVPGTAVTMAIIPAILRWKVPTTVLGYAIATLVTLVELAEFLPYLVRPEVKPQAFFSFVVVTTLWFGLIPMRFAMMLSAAAYAALAALVLSRTTYDLGLLIYLASVTAVVGVVASFGQQVSAHQQKAAAFQQQSLTDALTGLPNRRALLGELHVLWAAKDTSLTTPFALLMLDLDHFKAVNDTHGHTVGDQVLQALGPALRGLIRSADILARWGGEEFMLLIPDTTAQGAYSTAARLSGLVLDSSAPIPGVTFSAGAALSHEARTLDDLLALVDARLHAAKDAGRQQVRWDASPVPSAGNEESAVFN